jgi:hypothetical protein
MKHSRLARIATVSLAVAAVAAPTAMARSDSPPLRADDAVGGIASRSPREQQDLV